MSELTPDSIVERLRDNAERAHAAALGDPDCGHIHEAEAIEWTAAADRIAKVEAEQDALREALDEMLHSAGAPEGEAYIVLHRSDDGKVTVEGQAEHVGFVWQSPQGLQWGGPEGTGHRTERPVYRVVPVEDRPVPEDGERT